MAVPKKKVSKSRRNKRRAHDALGRVNIVVNKTTGEIQLPHQVSIDGYYKDKQVIVEKEKNTDENSENSETVTTEQEEKKEVAKKA